MNFDIIPPITGKDCFAKMGAIRDINRLKRTYGGTNWKNARAFALSK
ncbi:hypothetical protein [Moraxella caprae]|nr:hypothetical protein [Moraxella caprae]